MASSWGNQLTVQIDTDTVHDDLASPSFRCEARICRMPAVYIANVTCLPNAASTFETFAFLCMEGTALVASYGHVAEPLSFT